jgi:hypothetical protein
VHRVEDELTLGGQPQSLGTQYLGERRIGHSVERTRGRVGWAVRNLRAWGSLSACLTAS